MPSYIVTYDINDEVRYPDVSGCIEKNFDYARVSESAYVISTQKDVFQIYNTFKDLLDNNDQLYVMKCSKPYVGQGDVEVNDWLEAHLD